MRRWWILSVCTGAALLAALSLFASPALCSVSVGLSPPMVEMTTEPGAESSFEVMVTNGSQTAQLNLRVFLRSVEEQRDGAYTVLEKESPWSAVPWLQLASDGLNIAPRRTQAAVIKVKIPRGASGTRAAAVVFEVVPALGPNAQAQDTMAGSTQFKNQLLTIVKLTANSRSNRRAASIVGLNAYGPSAEPGLATYGKQALKIACSVKNEGNVLLDTSGRLVIRNSENRRVKEIPLGAGRGAVIPGATLDLASILPQGLPDGEYTAEATVRYGGPSPLRATVPFTFANQLVAAEGARAAVRLTVEPGRVETQLPAGSFRGFSLSVANLEDGPVTVHASVRPVVTRAGEFEVSEEAGGPWSAAGWLALSLETAKLQPGERKNLRVNVNVPKDTDDGSRYAAVVLEATKDGAEKTSATTTLLTPLIVSVGKDMVKKVALESAGLGVPDPGEALLVAAKVGNKGNTHVTVAGRVVLQRKTVRAGATEGMEVVGDRFEEIAVLPIAQTGLILPGTSIPLVVRYDQPLLPGEYQAVLVVEGGSETPLTVTMPFEIAPPAPPPKKSGK